mgnify:CR=1 FL=1
MTEREMFDVAVPKIAEMVVEARKLTDEEFAQWKVESCRILQSESGHL